MVESDGTNRGAPCGSCGYRNRPGSNLCSLCGSYLYDRALAQAAQRACTGVLPSAAAAAAPPPRPAAQPAPEAPGRRAAAPIALGAGDDLYPSPAAPPRPHGQALAADRAVEDELKTAEAVDAAPAPPEPVSPAPAFARAPDPLARPGRKLKGAPDELTSDLLEERLRRERATRRAWKAVGLAFAASTALGVPGSLHPLSLLLNGTGAVLYGFPLGYICSRRAIGVLPGAALGMLAGALYAIPLSLLFALFLGWSAAACAAQVIRGALSGLLPGAWAGRRVRG